MKLSKLILTLMFIMLLATSLTGKPIYGGFGGFSYSGMYNDYSSLNQYFTNAGLPAISNSLYFNEGGAGYGIINNIIIGGSSISSNTVSENNNITAYINAEGGFFELGYMFDIIQYIDIFPIIGFGSMNYKIVLRPELGDITFDSLLLTPARVSTLDKNSIAGHISGNIMFKLPFASEHAFVGLMLGGGYMIAPSFGNWKLEDGSIVRNGPEMPLGTPYGKVCIVFGGGN